MIKNVVLFVLMSVTLAAQRGRGGPPRAARAGTIEHATVSGKSVDVYLPPSYADDAMRKFPTVYLIGERPFENLKLTEAADKLAAQQGFSEAIVAMSDDLADDLVPYVDGHYRTITARISRGLGGVSLGGDAALRVGMKRSDVFSSLYLLNASLVDATVAMLDANAAGMQHFYGVSISVGTGDAALAMNRRLHDAMTRLKIPHYYEEYGGGRAELSERIESRLLPFFSKNLTAPANPTSPAVQ